MTLNEQLVVLYIDLFSEQHDYLKDVTKIADAKQLSLVVLIYSGSQIS